VADGLAVVRPRRGRCESCSTVAEALAVAAGLAVAVDAGAAAVAALVALGLDHAASPFGMIERA
jgi:hypothetical protein